MTRKGELGCPNCDGPCLGCFEDTPSEHAECKPSDAVVTGLGSSPSGGATSDTEKRIAEIEAYARLGNNQDFLWLIAEVRRLKVFETSALDTINDLSFNADGSAFKSMLSNDAVRKERDQALAELRASQAEVAKLRDTFKEEHAELLVGSATLREERDAARAECEHLKRSHESACVLVADMHAAAMGEVCGPKLGVVEDVTALRAKLAEAVAHIEWQQTLMKIEASLARTDDNTRLSEVLNAESTKLGAFLATVTK